MSNDAELELRDYLGVLWRRKKFILLAVLLLVTAALGLSYIQTPVYQATAEFFPSTTTNADGVPSSGGSSSKGNDPGSQAVGLIQGPLIRQRVSDQLGNAPKVAAVASPPSVQVKAESTDPKEAAAVADAYVKQYIEFRRSQDLDGINKAIAQIQPRYDANQRRVDEINRQLAANPLARQTLEIQLGPERDQKQRLADADSQVLAQLRLSLATKTNDNTIVTPAKVPKSPVRPKPLRNGALAVPVGLVVGVALAFLFEHLDDSLKSKEDLERITGSGVPVVGVIPAVRIRDDAGSELVALAAPDSPVAEAYRTMRTSVQFLALDDSLGSIQITSPSAGEGKTTTLANLAVVMARAGAKVVVIDCDLRRPRLHEVFGVPNDIGFTSVFQGQVPLSGALQAIPGERNLRVLPSGPLPPNPSELLGSRRTAGILASLKAQGALVLLDCPPIMPVTDAAALSAWVDTTIIVVSYGTTTKRQLQRSVELLRQVDAPLVGTVLNRAQGSEGYGYSYGYYHRRPDADARRKPTNGQVVPAPSASRTGG